MTGELLTLWTIRAALALYAVVAGAWLGGVRAADWLRAARWLWAAACLAFLAHVVCAFHFYHEWSHAAAFEQTASETERVMGFRFGWGVYCNHLFAAVWTADSLWWLLRPQQYLARGAAWWLGVHGYLFFIIFNGAVVFEDGMVRWASVACLAAAATLATMRGRRGAAAAPDG